MKTHALTIKIRAKKPKNVCNCESAARLEKIVTIGEAEQSNEAANQKPDKSLKLRGHFACRNYAAAIPDPASGLTQSG